MTRVAGARGIEQRVIQAAEATLAEKQYVSAIDVLMRLAWLPPSGVDAWRQGRVPSLETAVTAGLGKISTAMQGFRRWARQRGLEPSETAYVSRARDRRPLRFSISGDPAIERAYRTHWVSKKLSERKRQRLAERVSRPPDLLVIAPLGEWACSSCGGTGDLLIMEGPGPLCLRCADMDHLVFLPAGDAALTRRAKRSSRLSAVVVRFSRSRDRYERQGILVGETSLEKAEQDCLADADARARRRERDELCRVGEDRALQAAIADEIQRLFPGCPPQRAEVIARYTATRGSGRVGRTAAARELDHSAIEFAVVASVRHLDTGYDDLRMSGVDRSDARERVQPDVARVLDGWRQPPAV